MKNLQPLSNRTEAARGSNLAQVKTHQMAREEDEKFRQRRVKGIIVLMEQFLADQGYAKSLQALQQDSGITLQQYAAADNMDLVCAVAEFEQYYEFKFNRKPKLFRLRSGENENDGIRVITDASGEKQLVRKRGPVCVSASSPTYSNVASPLDDPNGNAGANHGRPGQLKPIGNLGRALAAAQAGTPPATGQVSPSTPRKRGEPTFSLEGQKVGQGGAAPKSNVADDDGFSYGRPLKPMPIFPTTELTDLASSIMRDILDVNPNVTWSDIAELDSVKHLLKEAVVMPVKYPELFEGIVRPWKGFLLFGPPGTGKTLLAKAVATECRTTFFNISASSVVSKWRGDSEKLVRMLFDLAVHYSPSTIFIDEVDSLMSARSTDGEHEGSRRMKAELLTQMDGLSKRRGGDVVFVLAACNTPWDLDNAILRRLEKRVLVTLPTGAARQKIFRKLLGDSVVDPATFDWDLCAEITHGMSGADIDIVCREAMMRPIRAMLAILESHSVSQEKLGQVPLERPNVTIEDIRASVACTCGSVSASDLRKYDEWAKVYGSGMSK